VSTCPSCAREVSEGIVFCPDRRAAGSSPVPQVVRIFTE
jgi:hypothetical protein